MATYHAAKGIAQGAAKTASDALKGAGVLSGSETVTRAGATLERKIERAFPVPPAKRRKRRAGAVPRRAGNGPMRSSRP